MQLRGLFNPNLASLSFSLTSGLLDGFLSPTSLPELSFEILCLTYSVCFLPNIGFLSPNFGSNFWGFNSLLNPVPP